MEIAQNDTVLASTFAIPTGSYRVRVINTKLGKSNAGNPMTTLGCEIISPEVVEVDGEEKSVAGRPFNLYLVHIPSLVGAQRVSSQGQVFEFMDRLNLKSMMKDGDTSNPKYVTEHHKEYFLGMMFDIILRAKTNIKRKKLTDEDKAAGKKSGDPILDGEGKEIIDGYNIEANISDVPIYCNPERDDSIAY